MVRVLWTSKPKTLLKVLAWGMGKKVPRKGTVTLTARKDGQFFKQVKSK
jgi:hypothetical protein